MFFSLLYYSYKNGRFVFIFFFDKIRAWQPYIGSIIQETLMGSWNSQVWPHPLPSCTPSSMGAHAIISPLPLMLCSQYLCSPSANLHSPRAAWISGAQLSIVQRELASLPREALPGTTKMELRPPSVMGTSVAESLHSGLRLSGSTTGWILNKLLTHFVGWEHLCFLHKVVIRLRWDDACQRWSIHVRAQYQLETLLPSTLCP